MLRVDNLGRGNCMYYAYAISLSYFLKNTKNINLASQIFKRLELTETHTCSLLKILDGYSQNPEQNFSKQALNDIQIILGPALRNFAGNSIYKLFKASPYDTNLFAAAIFQIRKEIATPPTSLIEHIESSELIDRAGNYTQAEIFRTPGIIKAMQNYAINIKERLEKEFDAQSDQKTKKDKLIILDNLIREAVIEFFLQNDEYNLKQYISHLQTDYVWGSEETLMAMNSALIGEKQVRQASGQLLRTCDFELEISIHRDGTPPPPKLFAKIIINQDPSQINHDELLKLLENRPGYVLYNNVIYYIGIDPTLYIQKGPQIQQITDYERLDWQTKSSCLDQELKILARAIPPRAKDIKYLQENYYAIILQNEGNTHWTSLIPQPYQNQKKNNPHYSLFCAGMTGIAAGEITNLLLPIIVENIQQFLGLTHLASHLSMLAAFAIIFMVVAQILNYFQCKPTAPYQLDEQLKHSFFHA